MADDRPTTADREQQRADNVASRRQSGLEPLPRDRLADDAEEQNAATEAAADERSQADTNTGDAGK